MNRDTNKIRIAYLINHFGEGGGTENQLGILIRNLDRSRYEPHLIILKHIRTEKATGLDCPVTYLNITRFVSLKFPIALWKLIRYLRKTRIEVLQLFFFDARIIGTIAGGIAGVSRIVACRRDFRNALPRKQLIVLRWLRHLVTHMLVNAHRVKEMVTTTELFPPERITVIHNGVEMMSNGGSDPLLEQNVVLDKTRPVIGMVANIRPVKRIDRFLQLAAGLRHRQAQFLLVGGTWEPEDFWALVDEMGVRDCVQMTHILHDIDRVIKRFDVALLTSESEGLSNSLIEYCLCGKPAVAFDVGGNAEVIADGETGFVLPDGDLPGVIEKIEYLLDNPEVAAEMGARSATRARSMFGVDRMVRATERFYDTIMDRAVTNANEVSHDHVRH